jgi:hypothetical protein
MQPLLILLDPGVDDGAGEGQRDIDNSLCKDVLAESASVNACLIKRPASTAIAASSHSFYLLRLLQCCTGV